jgi:hypothetical protein
MRFNMSHVDTSTQFEKDVVKISWQAWSEILENIRHEMISDEIFNWFNQIILRFYQKNRSIQIFYNTSSIWDLW